MIINVQVVFQQGLIKSFVLNDEMTVARFMQRIESFGRFRLIRSMRPASAVEQNDPNTIFLGD